MSPKPTAPADVAIITVSYNSSAQLADFLASAIKSVASPSQITVVDNNSADIDITQKLTTRLGVNLLKLDKNVGYGGAVNKAVPGLEPQLTTLLVCNPDSELNIAAVHRLSEAVKDPKVGVAGPRIFNEDGSVYPSARNIPSIRNGVGHGLFANIWPSNPWTKNYLSQAHSQESTVTTGWVSGACLAIRREIFEYVGGFDDHYFMYFEDVDLGYRLGLLGFENIYIPEVFVIHTGGESTRPLKQNMVKIHHQSAAYFVDKKYKKTAWTVIRLPIKLGLIFRWKLYSCMTRIKLPKR
ncbi:glycosyltransferase family 2 protein [Aurantimicrobium minutum]|uniref:glycosyltransferase family 2 protein n=1 Tax=Aurantimicrobium minutum TaxID=708131 RepID=UPI0024746223|nr:glycosyltransferase family 2 protein [Aurantimicrobium minutum]MDH6239037.1 N-acetylglucosaminyl-diphospho-decaprenol L-rhamnosyltransferase [Aurantimicrobium minutum]